MRPSQLYEKIKNTSQGMELFKLLEVHSKTPVDDQAEALFYLGECYREGFVVARDPEQAFRLYEQASQWTNWYGTMMVFCALANCYEYGSGVQRDTTKAAEFYYRAALQQDTIYMLQGESPFLKLKSLADKEPINVTALLNVARCYERNYYNRQQNLLSAANYYEKASGLGSAEASFLRGKLNLMTDFGINATEAAKWFLLSARTGHYRDAAARLIEIADEPGADIAIKLMKGQLFENGWGVEKSYDAARNIYQAGVDKDSDLAMVRMAELYREGNGVDKSDHKAFEWYKKAAFKNTSNEAGSIQAVREMEKIAEAHPDDNAEMLYLIAYCYYYGRGVKTDRTKSLELNKRAAEKGNGSSAYNVNAQYYRGEGAGKNLQESTRWLYKAAKLNKPGNNYLALKYLKSRSAHFETGACYFHGYETAVDYKQAFTSFTRAPDDDRALYYLGKMYEEGNGVTQNLSTAISYYFKSVQKSSHPEEGGKEALRRLEALAAQSPPEVDALHSMAYCYHDGLGGVDQNPETAIDYFSRELDILSAELTSPVVPAKEIARKIKRLCEVTQALFKNHLIVLEKRRKELSPQQHPEINEIDGLKDILNRLIQHPDQAATMRQDMALRTELVRENTTLAKHLLTFIDREEKMEYSLAQRRHCLETLRKEIATKAKNDEWEKQLMGFTIKSMPDDVKDLDKKLQKLGSLSSFVELLDLYSEVETFFAEKEPESTSWVSSSKVFYSQWRKLFTNMYFEADFDQVYTIVKWSPEKPSEGPLQLILVPISYFSPPTTGEQPGNQNQPPPSFLSSP